MDSDEELYHQLLFYTLSHGDSSFIHQHAVDTYAAQHATAGSKPISVTFSLLGLYLWLERGFTGKQVQQAHMRLARPGKQWPAFDVPANRGRITVADVLEAAPNHDRDEMIRKWAAEVWNTWDAAHDQIRNLAAEELQLAD